jgi:hypothetical protein
VLCWNLVGDRGFYDFSQSLQAIAGILLSPLLSFYLTLHSVPPDSVVMQPTKENTYFVNLSVSILLKMAGLTK